MLMLMTLWSLRQAESIGELALREQRQGGGQLMSNRIDSCAQMRVLDASKPVMKHEDDFEVEPTANLQPHANKLRLAPWAIGKRRA